MMQEQIPVENDYVPQQVCGWCPNPAIDEVMLEKPQHTMAKRKGKLIKVVKKHAIMAGVCQNHKDILDRQPTSEKPDNYKVQ